MNFDTLRPYLRQIFTMFDFVMVQNCLNPWFTVLILFTTEALIDRFFSINFLETVETGVQSTRNMACAAPVRLKYGVRVVDEKLADWNIANFDDFQFFAFELIP